MKVPRVAILAAVLAASLLYAQPSEAAGKPVNCVVTIRKLELKDVSGRWVTAFEGAVQADLVNQDNPALQFQNDGRIPAGEYTNFRVTMAERVSVTGSILEHHTNPGGEAVIRGSAAKAGLKGRVLSYIPKKQTSTEAAAGPVQLTLDYDQGDRDDFIQLYGMRELKKRLKVKAASKLRVWIDFDLSGTLRYAFPDMLGPGIPAEDAMLFEFSAPREASMQSDGVSSGFASADLTLDY